MSLDDDLVELGETIAATKATQAERKRCLAWLEEWGETSLQDCIKAIREGKAVPSEETAMLPTKHYPCPRCGVTSDYEHPDPCPEWVG